jgi:predicted nucleic acid-binding protein
MILIDTNAISELWRPAPDARVIAWFNAQAIETLYISAVTVAELRYGIAVLPVGHRRQTLHARMERDVFQLFGGRVLPFDLDASQAYADLMARAQAAGRPIGMADAYIAATAASRRLMVATPDTSPFEAAGLTIINPWQA